SSARSKVPPRKPSRVTSPTKNVLATPARRARSRPFATARAAKSTPTASQPCWARYTTFVPVPHPRSRALPGGLTATKRTSSGGVIPVSQRRRPGTQYQRLNSIRRIAGDLRAGLLGQGVPDDVPTARGNDRSGLAKDAHVLARR